jgi:ribosomal protein S18 acetylase RimI-like enzyme
MESDMQYAGPVAMTTRPSRPEDAEGITRVYMESAEHHAGLDLGRYFVPSAEAIRTRYRDGRQHAGTEAITIVAELDGEIVGFIDARLDRSPDPMHRDLAYCHIIDIAVAESHRQQGIGAQLMRAAEDWGREQGATLASLEYLVGNTRAAASYQRIGYSIAAIIAIKRL